MADEVDNGNVDSIFHIGDLSYATGFLVEWDFFLHLITHIASKTAIRNHERDYIGTGSVYTTLVECGFDTLNGTLIYNLVLILQFTARELFKQFGCSERLHRDVIGPLLQVGLFAPAEQCSAAATLGILYDFILAYQKRFDPWMDSMRTRDCEFLDGRKVTDFVLNEETGCISKVVCGKEKYNADAVILAVGISTLRTCQEQAIVLCSAALCTREEFLKVSNLSCIDVITVKLWFDKKVNIPNASNACSGFGDSFAWTFFDLNQIYDEHKDDPVTVLQADFYHANELLPAYH
ncbi:hypothetical protein Q3G72_020935 [Acer saccharum]|nr:hypothetical protein Q3G72_020935 [Acer saccharum]